MFTEVMFNGQTIKLYHQILDKQHIKPFIYDYWLPLETLVEILDCQEDDVRIFLGLNHQSSLTASALTVKLSTDNNHFGKNKTFISMRYLSQIFQHTNNQKIQVWLQYLQEKKIG